MKTVYIILSQSGTTISRILKWFTHERYNHASLCLDPSFQTFYSFGRKHPYFPIPGGFIEEHTNTGVYARFSSIPCMIVQKEVTEEQFEQLQKKIQFFLTHQHEYSYAIISLFLANTPLDVTQKKKFFCSQFVAQMLNEIGIVTPRVPIHSHPFDFISLPESEIVYEGDLKKYKK